MHVNGPMMPTGKSYYFKKLFFMKKISNSIIKDTSKWHQYSFITSFFVPEFITALVLYSIPLLIDARFIAYLQSTSAYATLGLTNTLLHFILKVAEGASVGILVITGQENIKEQNDITLSIAVTMVKFVSPTAKILKYSRTSAIRLVINEYKTARRNFTSILQFLSLLKTWSCYVFDQGLPVL